VNAIQEWLQAVAEERVWDKRLLADLLSEDLAQSLESAISLAAAASCPPPDGPPALSATAWPAADVQSQSLLQHVERRSPSPVAPLPGGGGATCPRGLHETGQLIHAALQHSSAVGVRASMELLEARSAAAALPRAASAAFPAAGARGAPHMQAVAEPDRLAQTPSPEPRIASARYAGMRLEAVWKIAADNKTTQQSVHPAAQQDKPLSKHKPRQNVHSHPLLIDEGDEVNCAETLYKEYDDFLTQCPPANFNIGPARYRAAARGALAAPCRAALSALTQNARRPCHGQLKHYLARGECAGQHPGI